jgi:hypothetical protein
MLKYKREEMACGREVTVRRRVRMALILAKREEMLE